MSEKKADKEIRVDIKGSRFCIGDDTCHYMNLVAECPVCNENVSVNIFHDGRFCLTRIGDNCTHKIDVLGFNDEGYCSCFTFFVTQKEFNNYLKQKRLETVSSRLQVREGTCFRKALDKERMDLLEYLLCQDEFDFEEATDIINNCYLVVIDGYVPDGLGYTGNVIVLIGSENPGMIDVFTYMNGKLVKEDKE